MPLQVCSVCFSLWCSLVMYVESCVCERPGCNETINLSCPACTPAEHMNIYIYIYMQPLCLPAQLHATSEHSVPARMSCGPDHASRLRSTIRKPALPGQKPQGHRRTP
jgi:hypothetical protein